VAARRLGIDRADGKLRRDCADDAAQPPNELVGEPWQVGASQQHPLLHEDNRQHAMFLQQATGNMQHSGSTDDAALQPCLFAP
jgi:hypothetical protein